jgi:hypothetical protein
MDDHHRHELKGCGSGAVDVVRTFASSLRALAFRVSRVFRLPIEKIFEAPDD